MIKQGEPQTGRTALQWAVSFLIERGFLSDKAQLESRLLLGKAKEQEGIQLVTTLDDVLKEEVWELYRVLVIRLSQHEPLQYLTGQQDFMGLSFKITPAVLIPRWDTEVLVEEALSYLHTVASPKVLDLGTGSGVIAISLAYHKPESFVWAVDISAAALEVARDNAVFLGVAERITFLEGDLFAPLLPENQFDLIISNPPYITETEYLQLSAEVKKEPLCALVGGCDGLDYYRRIAGSAAQYLAIGGRILLEIGWKQGEEVSQLLKENGFRDVRVLQDTAGHSRVVMGEIGMIFANK